MNYDKERIAKILADIEKYLADLDELNVKNIGDLEDKKNFYSMSMVLLSITNRVIDLGSEMVAANNVGLPATYKDIFTMLAKKGIVDNVTGEKLSRLVFYRNLLSHEYYDLSTKDVFDVYKRIGIVKVFVNRAKEVLRK